MNNTLQKILPKIIKIRHTIHENAELAHQEFATATLIIETLKEFGYTAVTQVANTGVVAILDSGKPGKTVALRADIDALPIQEKNDLSFKSKNNGVMHACGHD